MPDFQSTLKPVYAIIPAAGTGSRMQAGQNKQFLKVGLYPVIIRTLRVFADHPRVNGFLVVAAPDEVDAMSELLTDFNLPRCLGVVAGGASRQDSVSLGLEGLSRLAADCVNSLVLVHDGARCFVTPQVIDRVIDGVLTHDACGAAMPVKDTIKRASRDGRVIETLTREELWGMQTPQGATFPILQKAYERARSEAWQTTDDLSVLEKSGVSVWLSTGDYRNIKLTTPEDLLFAQRLAAEADAAEI